MNKFSVHSTQFTVHRGIGVQLLLLFCVLCTVYCTFCLFSCAGGTGVGTPGIVDALASSPATVTGEVYTPLGKPLASGTATLIPANYRYSPYKEAYADYNPGVLTAPIRNGAYTFSPLDTGAYNLEADDLQGSKVLVTGMHFPVLATRLPACTLQATAKLAGTVADSGLAPAESSLVYIPGTTYFAYTDSTGAFAFDALPPGRYQVGMSAVANRMVSDTGLAPAGAVDTAITVTPEDSLTIQFSPSNLLPSKP